MTEPADQGWYRAPELKPRDLALTPRCTCSSADAFNPELPAMKHPRHEGAVCGVRLPDGVHQD